MRPSNSKWLAAALTVALGVGCGPSGPGVLQATGTIDFGTRFCSLEKSLELSNVGASSLSVTGARRTSGAPVKVAPYLDEPGAVFRVDLPANLTLPAQGTLSVVVAYTPPPDGLQVRHESKVAFQSGDQQVEVTLRASHASTAFEAPAVLDFGGVRPGESLELPLAVIDPTGAGRSAVVTVPGGPFSLTDAGVAFSPTATGEFTAQAALQPFECIAARPVQLLGTGVDQVVTVSPGALDFSYVPVGLSLTLAVSFRNAASRPVTFSQVGVYEGATLAPLFKVESSQDPSRLSLAPGSRTDAGVLQPQETKLLVSFTPTALGPRTATLRGTSDLAGTANLVVPVRGAGGGADIEVLPGTTLDFGAVTEASTRVLTVRNAGARPPMADTRANLHLGTDGGAPYFELVHVSGATGNLTVTGPDGYNAETGLEPTAVTAEFTVRATAAGASEHTLRIPSNDLDEPVVSVRILTR